MEHRTSLATIRTIALRVGTTAGRTATTVARGVVGRIAERRAARSSTPPGAVPRAPRAVPAEPVPHPEPTTTRSAAASPTDVARAVARNDAGLSRTNPAAQRRQAPRRGGPGAKLPARAGHGIVGV